MMKNIKNYALSLGVVLLATGCSQKYLEDIKPYNFLDDNLFTNETQTGWYIDQMYNNYFAAYKSPMLSVVGSYTNTRSGSTEEVGGVTDYTNPNKTLINATDADAYYGNALTGSVQNNPYTRIRYCNFLLAKINTVGQALSETFRNTTRGQAYFLRALQYFDLMRVYGGVPVITTVQDLTTNIDPSFQVPRAKPADVVAQIETDLDSAAALLPAVWDAPNYGRLTSAAALAEKSRVLLTFASPLYNPDWDNPGNARWDAALKAGLDAETALTAAGYGLYGSSAKDWATMLSSSSKAFANEAKEGIIVQLMSASNAASGILSNGWEKSVRLLQQGGSGGMSAPKEMIDLFPLADGSRPTVDNGYDSTHFFMNRDPRFYRTFAFSGMKWGTAASPLQDTVWLYRWAANNKPFYSNGNTGIMSPAVVRKMSSTSAAAATFAFSPTTIYDYRYAELLLNIAECYAAKGDIANTLLYLGKVRARVGIPAANNYGIGNLSTKYQAIEACLYERRVELAYEGKRFWDIQRWMLYDGGDATTGTNTCTALGVTPLNGTARNGRLWQYKTNLSANVDPLTAQKAAILVDPDAANFQAQLDNLKKFFDDNLTIVGTDVPMDQVSGQAVNINFRHNYYISGLSSPVLSTNPWLTQTIGWNDYNGNPGTFNYRQ